jgi:hypothetical protein
VFTSRFSPYVLELWQVERTGGRTETVAPHASEENVGKMGEHLTVFNNDTLDALYGIVDELARDLIEVEKVKVAA